MITVIGLGFVGLTTALGFSHKGFKVLGYDSDKNRARDIKSGRMPFYEPFLKEKLSGQRGRNFFIADDLKEAVSNSKAIFFCVGTPSKDNGSVDLGCLLKAIREVVRYVDEKTYRVLVIKSSVPPSTAEEVIKPVLERSGFKVGKDIGLVSNPEFLREGCAWEDFVNPDRIILGSSDISSSRILINLYKSFKAKIFSVSLNTAEFIKYFSNALLANLISFSNEMSIAADIIGDIDIEAAFKIIHLDRRWSGYPAKMTSYLYPGCGFGGYCLPKDIKAFDALLSGKGYMPLMIRDSIAVNNGIKQHVCSKIEAGADKNDRVGILGLSFKPNSDDVRETPAKDIIERLISMRFKKITAYDPMAIHNFKTAYGLPIQYESSLARIVKRSDSLVILTAWDEFRKIRTIFKKDLVHKKILDFRYILK